MLKEHSVGKEQMVSWVMLAYRQKTKNAIIMDKITIINLNQFIKLRRNKFILIKLIIVLIINND